MWRVGTVVALHDETPTARTITLEIPDWPGHLAGQHVDVRLTAADGYSAVRSYSIASAANPERHVELTVERLPNGEVSPYLTQEVAVSDRLELRGPIGGWFVWRTQRADPTRSRRFRPRAAYGYDSLACGCGQHCAVSIVVFRARTESGFLQQ
jgi:ferredoxin-NADP reductase